MTDEVQSNSVPSDSAAAPRDEAMLGWMEVAPFGILTTDTELRVRSWNRWLASHSGLTEAMVVGRFLFEVFPDISARRLEGPFQRALLGETSVLSTALHQYLLPLPAGSRESGAGQMRQTARVAPLLAGTSIVGTISILEDVTQREQQAYVLRRQQEHDRLLSSSLALLLESNQPLDAMAELFPRLATSLKLDVFFNFLIPLGTRDMRLHAASGVPAEVRRSLGALTVDDDSPCSWCARNRESVILPHVQTSGEAHAELPKKLGLRSYAAFPLMIGDRLLGTLSFGSYGRAVMAADEIGFLRTISQYLSVTIDRAQRDQALREAQAALGRHADTLEVKVTERTARLRETIEELESFSHTVAHDLRAPIRWLSGYSEMLLSDYGDTLPQGAQEIASRILHASSRLDALTRDLLSFSKIAKENVELEPVVVAQVIADLVALTPGFQESVVVEGDLGRVLAQRTLLQQCLSNLFDNALKFARPGVPPRIVVRAEHRAGGPGPSALLNPLLRPSSAPPIAVALESSVEAAGWTRLWIEDNGIGIAPEMHGRIFGIFERASGMDHIEGTGIGLAIVTRSTQRMGGACGVESSVGQGSRFWLDLMSPDAA